MEIAGKGEKKHYIGLNNYAQIKTLLDVLDALEMI